MRVNGVFLCNQAGWEKVLAANHTICDRKTFVNKNHIDVLVNDLNSPVIEFKPVNYSPGLHQPTSFISSSPVLFQSNWKNFTPPPPFPPQPFHHYVRSGSLAFEQLIWTALNCIFERTKQFYNSLYTNRRHLSEGLSYFQSINKWHRYVTTGYHHGDKVCPSLTSKGSITSMLLWDFGFFLLKGSRKETKLPKVHKMF